MKYLFPFLFLFFCACKKEAPLSPTQPPTFKLEEFIEETDLSNLLELNKILELDIQTDALIKEVNKITFFEDKTIVLDHPSEEEEGILVFDTNNGKFLNRIGKKGNNLGEYVGLRDFTIDSNKKELVALVAGKMALMRYQLDGTFINSTKVDFFGDEIAQLEHGDFMVYNEYNSTPETGTNHYIKIDAQGKIIQNYFPYNKKHDNAGLSLAGALTATHEGYLFNTPFDYTYHKIDKNGNISPFLKIDVGNKMVTEELMDKPHFYFSPELMETIFLDEEFALNEDLFLFKYFQDRKIIDAIYDLESDKIYSVKKAKDSFLQHLIFFGGYNTYNEQTFVLHVEGGHIKRLVQKYPALFKEFVQEYPEAEKLADITDIDNPVLFFLKKKK